jgi:hypothetical protein
MTIFASPDFGASGGIFVFLIIAWGIVFALVSIGLYLGARFFRKESPKAKKLGVLITLVSGLTPFFCCMAPPLAVRIFYGNYPIGSSHGKIDEGMSKDEVTAILGNPHERFKQDEQEKWFYWFDSFGIGWFGVDFGSDGHVIRTYAN